ncbi:hypothetical protein CRUP_030147 [Coryphaenoides rupestris]|nr:hypothetical protein CRUP_030147 [Coryphaenoides rupestris]
MYDVTPPRGTPLTSERGLRDEALSHTKKTHKQRDFRVRGDVFSAWDDWRPSWIINTSELSHKMTKSKDKKREKMSVATEIDRVEERRTRFQDHVESAELRSRREVLSDGERQDLEEEMSDMRQRVQKLDKELYTLRGENRKNMMLSVALFALSAFLYYAFIYAEEDL